MVLNRLCALVIALAVSWVVIATPQDAFAQTAAEKAKAFDHFKRGKELFEEGNYQGALVEFERANKLAPNWRVLFNIGQVKYQLQDYPGAVIALEKYLETGGTNVPPDRRKEVSSDIERLRARVAYVRIQVNEAGATIRVDGIEIGTSPLGEAIAVSAGRREISATLDGSTPVSKSVDLAGGDSLTVDLALTVSLDPSPKPTPDPDPGEPNDGGVPWAAWGVTAAFGIGAAVLGGLALNASSELDDQKSVETTKEALTSKRSKVLSFSIATDILLGATIIGAAISIYLTVDAGSSEDDDDPSPETGIRLTPGGIALEGTF